MLEVDWPQENKPMKEVSVRLGIDLSHLVEKILNFLLLEPGLEKEGFLDEFQVDTGP